MYDFETRNPKENILHGFLRDNGITDPSIIPYAVAEMRFDIAPEIKSALLDCVETGSFGYSMASHEYKQSVCSWMKRRHHWDIKEEWIIQSYGVVSVLAAAVKVFSKEGDGILIQSPVYPPFSRSVLGNDRRLLRNQLVKTGSTYTIDFEDFEAKAREAKVFLLCSPHNPVGRVWSRDELSKMINICLKHNVVIVADEIHNDLIMPGYTHTVAAAISPEAEDNCIICTAPSKTFNIAGLSTSNIIIKNPKLRNAISNELESFLNAPGLCACEAAYNKAEGWLDELIPYMDNNRKRVESFISTELPELKVTQLQGTYLMWIDMSSLGMTGTELQRFLKEKAQLAVNDGETFGPGGQGYIRFNIACPARYIDEALLRLKKAIRG